MLTSCQMKYLSSRVPCFKRHLITVYATSIIYVVVIAETSQKFKNSTVYSFAAATTALPLKCAVKTEKKTVQFSEDIQVETIEPEQEPVYIDEVRSLSSTLK